MSTPPPPPPGAPPPPPPGYGSVPPPPPPGPGYGSVPPPPPGAGQPPVFQYSAPAERRELAGFWARFGGMLLDWLLYGLLFAPFLIAGVVLIVQAYDDCVSIDDEIFCPPGAPEGGLIAIGVVVLVVGALLVAFIYLRALGRTGQTWGRKIVGLKVVREDSDAPLGFGKALLRQFIQSLISGSLFGLGYLWMLWDQKNQTWHDKIANTLVIKV